MMFGLWQFEFEFELGLGSCVRPCGTTLQAFSVTSLFLSCMAHEARAQYAASLHHFTKEIGGV